MAEISTSGAHFGKSQLIDASIVLRDTRDASLLKVPLDRASLCVVPTNNRDEVEIQFSEGASGAAKEDVLVQMTLHFPSAGREERERDEASLAQQFHQQIIDAGIIRSVTGEVIVEFGKEQGSFVAPRGKYALQMASSYFYMQGAQYAYKIPYDDISSLFLLPKLDAGRFAFVIALDKPVKQGQQRYSFLVMDSHSLEHTAHLTLSEQQLEQYEGQLQPEMTMSLCNLIAKVFKVLSNKKVFIPKQFLSARDAFCVRCAIKANEGLLYPLAKALLFIHKPTVLVKFEDIEQIEFRRYEPAANSATRNFDLAVTLKAGASSGEGSGRELVFMSIDRSEFASLNDYLKSRELNVISPQAKGDAAAGLGAQDDGDSEEEEDDDYSAGDSQSSSGSDSEASDDSSSGKKRKPRQKKGDQQKGKRSKVGRED